MVGSPLNGSWEGGVFERNRASGRNEQSIDEAKMMHLVKIIRLEFDMRDEGECDCMSWRG